MANHKIDETGKVYGKWKVLGPGLAVGTKTVGYWLCRCECGAEVSVRGSALRSGKSKCCYKCGRRQPPDVVNKKFGSWTILEFLGNNKVQVRCEKCGQEYKRRLENIINGTTTGCNNCKTFDFAFDQAVKRMVGKKFNMLTVDSFAFKSDKRVYYWNCTCDCGAKTVVATSELTLGGTKSCGCLTSVLERDIINWLTNNNKEYKHQVKIPLTLETGGQPIMDFEIKINSEWCFLEAQGEQHFKDAGEFGKYQRETTDQIKKDWCNTHGIRLFEIRYDQDVNEELTKIFAQDNTVPSLDESL